MQVRAGISVQRLHIDRENQNQGAESTLAFLLALAEMRLTLNFVTVFNQPAP